MKNEVEEIHTDLKKITIVATQKKFLIGTIVKWKYEWIGDPQVGTLYIVVGYNSESPNLVVTRVFNDLGSLREFDISQLEPI